MTAGKGGLRLGPATRVFWRGTISAEGIGRIRHRRLGLIAAFACAGAAVAPAAEADEVRGRMGLELSAQKQTGTTCVDPSAVCLPDGVFTIAVGNTNPAACRFDVSITWGDGAAESFSIGPTRDVAHHYTSPGVYTISLSGAGTPLEADTTCTGDSGTITVEVPAAPEITQKAEQLGEVSGLAGSFAEHLKKFLRLRLNRESGKLRKRAGQPVRDGKAAKVQLRELRQLGVPEEGGIVYPCPASRPMAPRRDCPGGELALTYLAGFPGNKTQYSQLNNEQKQIIASQIQVHSGAVRKALRDTQKAGKAGTEVAF